MLKVSISCRVRNQFVKRLKSDIKSVKQSNKTLKFADRTSIMYRLSKGENGELLSNVVISGLKKASNSIKKRINMDMKRILRNSDILNCVEINRSIIASLN